MDDRPFDMLTRQAAGSASRRGSMMTLAAAGFVAALATPFMAAAKQANAEKKRGKKKHKNNQPLTQPAPQECPPLPADLCPSQVQPCTDTFTRACGGNPDCQDAIPCCSHLETCDFSGFFSCLVTATA